MEPLLETNLSKPGVEQLAFANDPNDLQRRENGCIDRCKRLFQATALLSGVAALFPISPLWAVGGFGVSSFFLLSHYGHRWRKEHQAPDGYIALWGEWQDEAAFKAESSRIEQLAKNLKTSSSAGQEISWLILANDSRIQKSVVARDAHWHNFCDDLAGAAAEVGRLSVQSDRARHFRSTLLYAIRESVETLSQVAADVNDRSSWLPLLERKLQIAHLLTWIRGKDPRMINGYPNYLSDMERGLTEEMVRCYETRLNQLSWKR